VDWEDLTRELAFVERWGAPEYRFAALEPYLVQ
jgi:hypothetical protein